MHGKKDCANELPYDNKTRTGKAFEDGKKRTKQQVLIISTVNYIEHWEKARYVKTLQKVFHNIIFKY